CLLLFCALCASVAIRARAASFVISNDLPWTVSVAEFSSNAPAGYSVAAAPVILTNRQTASFPTNSVVIIGVARTNAGPPKLFATYQLAAMNGASGYANLSAVESNYYSRATVSLYTTNAP
ncbi:MAG: hypothetical protein KGR98_14475, partial [Verrucomicrobia bacterium]|nr:hypothetical protein [Verrucomicrobiota bacterium]